VALAAVTGEEGALIRDGLTMDVVVVWFVDISGGRKM
jgi:hypothetical protein